MGKSRSSCVTIVFPSQISHEDKDKELIFNFNRSPPLIETYLEATGDESWPELMKVSGRDIAFSRSPESNQSPRSIIPSKSRGN